MSADFWLEAKILGVIALFMVAFVVFLFVAPSLFPQSKWAYTAAYHTDETRVHISPKPGDCDFFYTPIGSKGCHYDRQLTIVRHGHAPNTLQPMMSLDDGRSWQVESGRVVGSPDPPRDIYVGWNKVNDW